MIRRPSFPLVLVCVLSVAWLAACGGTQGNQGPVVQIEKNAMVKSEGGEVKEPEPLTETSVSAWNLGPTGPLTSDDLRPMMSDGEAYNEKWEFTAYGDPYEVKLKFTVANLGWGDFKGRVNGFIKRTADGKSWKFDKKLDEGKWKYSKDGLFEITMGNFTVRGEPGDFRLTGEFDGHAFDVTLQGNSWRPGSGMTLFGQNLREYSKTATLIVQGSVEGNVTIDGETVPITGRAYANHFATNVGIHEVTDNVVRFRKHTDDLLIEFKHYVSTDKYNRAPFSFLCVSYDGVIVFEATDLQVTATGYFEDPAHPGYVAPHGIQVSAKVGEDEVRLSFPAGEVSINDPLAKLPAIERAVAEQITKPLEFKDDTTWRLDIFVGGYAGTIEDEGSYTTTLFK